MKPHIGMRGKVLITPLERVWWVRGVGLLLATRERQLRLTTFAHGPVNAHVEWAKTGEGSFEINIRLKMIEPGDMKLSTAFWLASRALWILYGEADLEERLKEVFDSQRKP